jgi:hypothetical protein
MTVTEKRYTDIERAGYIQRTQTTTCAQNSTLSVGVSMDGLARRFLERSPVNDRFALSIKV